jgi:PKD repeat protein
MQAKNLAGTSTASMTVIVIGNSEVNFTADTQSGTAPLWVKFTDASTPGGTAWTWDFGDGQTGTGTPVDHKYTADGKYDVTLTVTYPSPVGDQTVTKDQFIDVQAGLCDVPKLGGVRFNDAQAVWNGAGFTGTVLRGPGAPSGNFIITAQTLVYPNKESCSSDVYVTRP